MPFATVAGHSVSTRTSSGPPDSSWQLRSAEGDVEFSILFGVVNQSHLSLNLLGVSPDARGLPYPERLPRILGLGYLPNEHCCLPSDARPFSRMILHPGESVQLVVLGRAGRCASSTVEAGATLIESIPFVYEQLDAPTHG